MIFLICKTWNLQRFGYAYLYKQAGCEWQFQDHSGWVQALADGKTYTDANPLTYVSPSKALLYYYDFNNLARGGDDWFYIQA